MAPSDKVDGYIVVPLICKSAAVCTVACCCVVFVVRACVVSATSSERVLAARAFAATCESTLLIVCAVKPWVHSNGLDVLQSSRRSEQQWLTASNRSRQANGSCSCFGASPFSRPDALSPGGLLTCPPAMPPTLHSDGDVCVGAGQSVSVSGGRDAHATDFLGEKCSSLLLWVKGFVCGCDSFSSVSLVSVRLSVSLYVSVSLSLCLYLCLSTSYPGLCFFLAPRTHRRHRSNGH